MRDLLHKTNHTSKPTYQVTDSIINFITVVAMIITLEMRGLTGLGEAELFSNLLGSFFFSNLN